MPAVALIHRGIEDDFFVVCSQTDQALCATLDELSRQVGYGQTEPDCWHFPIEAINRVHWVLNGDAVSFHIDWWQLSMLRSLEPEQAAGMYYQMAQMLNPASGGDAAQFERLNRAWRVYNEYFLALPLYDE